MSLSNSTKFMVTSCKDVANINRALKDIKSDIMANFIQANHLGLTIMTNKVIFSLNLSTIEKYIKNVDSIDLDDIMMSRLP